MKLSKNIRFLFLLLIGIVRKKFLNILAGIFLGIIVYTLIPQILKFIPKPAGLLKVGEMGQLTLEEIPERILNQISYGLTSVNEKGEVTPLLAESWEVKEDGRVLDFKIKDKKIFWHDGKSFILADINYNFKDVVMSVENNIVSFKLKEPFSPFPEVVSKPIFKKGLIGIGGYRVKKITTKGKYLKEIYLIPFNDRTPPTLIYKFYPSEKDLKTAFNLGEINVVDNLFDCEGIVQGKNTIIEKKLRKDAYLAVFFDTSRPFLEDKTFRQALAYAAPKPKGEERAFGPINPLSWVYNPDVKPYLLDLDKAKKLIESSLKTIENTTFGLYTFPQYEKIALQIKSSWKKIGVKSEVRVSSFIPPEFDALLIAMEIPKEPDQYYFWHSTQSKNTTKLKNPRIDKFLEDGRRITNKEERKDIYYDFQRFLSEESPAIFLNHPTAYTVARNKNVLELFKLINQP